MREQEIQNKIRLAISKLGVYFRANVGTGWRGRTYTKRGNTLTITDPVPLSTGLPKGFSDLFGATIVEITPEMVGDKLAIFTLIEVKTPTGRVSKEQQNFLNVMKEAGAICGVARSEADAIKIIGGDSE